MVILQPPSEAPLPAGELPANIVGVWIVLHGEQIKWGGSGNCGVDIVDMMK